MAQQRESAVYTITFNEFLERIKDKELLLIDYYYARPTIVQIMIEVKGDTEDRDYRVNIDEVHNYNWSKKERELSEAAFLEWVWQRVVAYHKKHSDFNPRVFIDCIPPMQMMLF